ncbi:MAG: uncharacterized protein KVP18_003795 [Porospora cf. gigantea A]|uniref:uncharacterized protein n=2 Tax=Porospora cf. gigantea A TaxID=2853593 RepID=UPI00355AB435|nr:MAG: hypothetical protein KVP18_003795 [Porospora cf. gigantea A]
MSRKRARQSAEISSDSESAALAEESEESDFFVSPEEKKVKLAKALLSDLGSVPAAMPCNLSHADVSFGDPVFFRGHKNTVTSVCTGPDGSIFSGGKDGAVLQWDLERESKEVLLENLHSGSVTAVAYHPKSRILVTCGGDLAVSMYPLNDMDGAVHLTGHRQPPLALVVNPGTDDVDSVFSTGPDFQLRQWSCTHHACLKTLFGHTKSATALAIHTKDRPVSGGEDATLRQWKMETETHLLHHVKGQHSLDALACLSAQYTVAGTQAGNLLLFSSQSKKPVSVIEAAHGGSWVQSLCVVPGTDLVLSGSNDGYLRVWRAVECTEGRKRSRSLQKETSIPVDGFINGIVVQNRNVVLAVGRDSRIGRWESSKCKNGVVVIPYSV